MKKGLIASGLLGLAFILAACSDEGSDSAPETLSSQAEMKPVSPDATDGGTTNTDSTGIGNDPSSWAPVLITSNTNTVTLVPRQSAAFADYEYTAAPAGTQYLITSTAPSVAAPIASTDSMVPSFTAGTSGEAVITVSTYTGATPTPQTTVILEQVQVIVQ